MKSLLSFLSAISDLLRLRIVLLAHAHKITPSELAMVLKLNATDVANHLKALTDAGILKTESKSGYVRMKSSTDELIEVLCAHFGVSVKKDSILKADAKHAKQLRESRNQAEKEAKRQKKVKAATEAKAADSKKSKTSEPKNGKKPR